MAHGARPMLQRLSLRNFVLIESAEFDFCSGLNVLTGETGAGKSILIDAIGFLAGGRASADWLRPGADRCAVEGALERPDHREDGDEGLLILRRELGRDGRTRCFINGRQVLVSDLKAAAAGRLWIVDQGEQRALADPREQQWLLDLAGGCEELAVTYREERERWLEARAALEEMTATLEAFGREEDWLRFQAQEIREAGLEPGERRRLLELREGARGARREA